MQSFVDDVEATVSSKDEAKTRKLEEVQFGELRDLLEYSEKNGCCTALVYLLPFSFACNRLNSPVARLS